MLTLLTADSPLAGQADTINALVGLLRRHEAVLVVEDVDRCRQLVRLVRARLPRLRLLPLLADLPAGPDLDLVDELLESGAVPVIAVPDSTAEAVSQMLLARLRPDSVLRLGADGNGWGDLATPEPVPAPGAAGRTGDRARCLPVAGGWCTRPVGRACLHSAADGCSTCPHLATSPQYLPVHADLAERAHRLANQAQAAGEYQTAAANRRLAAAVDTLLATVG
jgi:hypothetical protein